MSQPQGKFIVLEGLDGAGKSTQIDLLRHHLQLQGVPTLVCREPGGTELGEALRIILKERTDLKLTPTAEAMLFCAARAQLVSTVIIPALAAGTTVLCDRYFYSTVAYQGTASGCPAPERAVIERMAGTSSMNIIPDLVVWLELPPSHALSRRLNADRPDRFDSRPLEYHQLVDNGYHRVSQLYSDPRRPYGTQFLRPDALQPVDQLAQDIYETAERLGLTKGPQ